MRLPTTMAVLMLAALATCAEAAAPPAKSPPSAAPQAPAAKAEAPAAPVFESLDQAVAAMRKVKPEDFATEEAQKAKGAQITAAWEKIIVAGPAGRERVKAELAAVDAAGEKDDFFRLGAAVVLWQSGQLDEVAAIAAAWAGDVNLTLNPNYVYFTAWEAARTQDPRALPVLKATLRERGLSVFIPQHAMTVAWPLTQEFLWTAYGPAGLPVLAQVLAESKDESALATAAILLGQAQYAEALPALRKLARDGTGEARGQALRALGLLGHPDDFPVLMAALKSSDAAVALHAAWALIEYDDLRGAAALVPLVDSKDEDLRREAVMGLAMLPTPEGVAALRRQAESAADEKERAYCARAVKGLVAASGVEADAWAAQSPEEQAKSLGVVLAASGAKYRLKPDDRLLSHEELLKACAEWQERGRLTGGNYVWVEDRHVLAAATAADIPLLLSVKARVCRRMSDECLPEMQILDALVRRLGRARYRKDVGVCAKVEPATATPAAK